MRCSAQGCHTRDTCILDRCCGRRCIRPLALAQRTAKHEPCAEAELHQRPGGQAERGGLGKALAAVASVGLALCPLNCDTLYAAEPAAYLPVVEEQSADMNVPSTAAFHHNPSAFDQALIQVVNRADGLSQATGAFADLTCISCSPGQQVPPAAVSMAAQISQEALAVAADTLKLASLIDPTSGFALEEWDLVQQIQEAAKVVSLMAGDLANQTGADTTLEQLLQAGSLQQGQDTSTTQ